MAWQHSMTRPHSIFKLISPSCAYYNKTYCLPKGFPFFLEKANDCFLKNRTKKMNTYEIQAHLWVSRSINFKMKIWSRRIAQNMNKKNLKNSALSVQGRIFQIFRSYFGQWDDSIFSFWNFLTFRKVRMFQIQ